MTQPDSTGDDLRFHEIVLQNKENNDISSNILPMEDNSKPKGLEARAVYVALREPPMSHQLPEPEEGHIQDLTFNAFHDNMGTIIDPHSYHPGDKKSVVVVANDPKVVVQPVFNQHSGERYSFLPFHITYHTLCVDSFLLSLPYRNCMRLASSLEVQIRLD